MYKQIQKSHQSDRDKKYWGNNDEKAKEKHQSSY